MKEMHRLIVTSATYRQSSRVRPELMTVDARNRLLARQNRVRLDAEVVRDVALTASGMLVRTMGGPSVPFFNGKAAMTPSVRSLTPNLRAQLKDDWDVALIPKGTVERRQNSNRKNTCALSKWRRSVSRSRTVGPRKAVFLTPGSGSRSCG